MEKRAGERGGEGMEEDGRVEENEEIGRIDGQMVEDEGGSEGGDTGGKGGMGKKMGDNGGEDGEVIGVGLYL